VWIVNFCESLSLTEMHSPSIKSIFVFSILYKYHGFYL
jgi:hypothetical protein